MVIVKLAMDPTNIIVCHVISQIFEKFNLIIHVNVFHIFSIFLLFKNILIISILILRILRLVLDIPNPDLEVVIVKHIRLISTWI